jgi:hypothetical protein
MPLPALRNADITRRLYRRPALDRGEAHRRCERVSRLIVKLRGHGLVAKVPRSRQYRVTPRRQRAGTRRRSEPYFPRDDRPTGTRSGRHAVECHRSPFDLREAPEVTEVTLPGAVAVCRRLDSLRADPSGRDVGAPEAQEQRARRARRPAYRLMGDDHGAGPCRWQT